jgi:hypothetical protein
MFQAFVLAWGGGGLHLVSASCTGYVFAEGGYPQKKIFRKEIQNFFF